MATMFWKEIADLMPLSGFRRQIGNIQYCFKVGIDFFKDWLNFSWENESQAISKNKINITLQCEYFTFIGWMKNCNKKFWMFFFLLLNAFFGFILDNNHS